MKKKLIIGIMLGVVTFLAAAPVLEANYGKSCSGGYGHGWQMKGGDLESKFYHKAYFFMGHGDDLGLSDKQEDEIKAIVFDVKKRLVTQDAEIKVLKLEIEQEMHKDSIHLDAVNKLVDQKYELKKAKSKFLIEAIAKLKGTLSDDQREKVKTIFKQGMMGYGKKSK